MPLDELKTVARVNNKNNNGPMYVFFPGIFGKPEVFKRLQSIFREEFCDLIIFNWTDPKQDYRTRHLSFKTPDDYMTDATAIVEAKLKPNQTLCPIGFSGGVKMADALANRIKLKDPKRVVRAAFIDSAANYCLRTNDPDSTKQLISIFNELFNSLEVKVEGQRVSPPQFSDQEIASIAKLPITVSPLENKFDFSKTDSSQVSKIIALMSTHLRLVNLHFDRIIISQETFAEFDTTCQVINGYIRLFNDFKFKRTKLDSVHSYATGKRSADFDKDRQDYAEQFVRVKLEGEHLTCLTDYAWSTAKSMQSFFIMSNPNLAASASRSSTRDDMDLAFPQLDDDEPMTGRSSSSSSDGENESGSDDRRLSLTSFRSSSQDSFQSPDSPLNSARAPSPFGSLSRDYFSTERVSARRANEFITSLRATTRGNTREQQMLLNSSSSSSSSPPLSSSDSSRSSSPTPMQLTPRG